MKRIIALKIIGYIIIIASAIIGAMNGFCMDTKGIMMIILTLPGCMMISNIVHEAGHFLFCKLFRLKVTHIHIGIFRYDFSKGEISVKEKGFIGGECAFIVGENLEPFRYFFVFMGGAIFNVIFCIISMMVIFFGINAAFNYGLAICFGLNALANGLYPKSTDLILMKKYIKKG